MSDRRMLEAARAGDNARIEALLQEGVSIEETNGSSSTPLIAAIRLRHYDTVLLLLERGADPNHNDAPNFSPIEYALEAPFIVKKLLEKGADVHHASLPQAIYWEMIETAHLLIEAGADINAPDFCFRSRGTPVAAIPLVAAVWRENLEMVNLLLKRGADVNAQDPDRFRSTALGSAASHQNVEIVRLLLEYGADVNLRLAAGSSALHNAVRACNPETVRLLLEHGADVDCRDEEGRSPLDMVHRFLSSPPEGPMRERWEHLPEIKSLLVR